MTEPELIKAVRSLCKESGLSASNLQAALDVVRNEYRIQAFREARGLDK